MQNLLLTIASAIILAVAAAFAAPFVVDWTQWRTGFEVQAARAFGAPVLIRGPIEAQILPSPKFVLHDVAVGVDGAGTGLVAAELSGRLKLGELIRGVFVADQLTLTGPRGRLVIDSAGKVALPTGTTRPVGLSVAALTIVDGALEVIDRAGGRSLKLDDIDLSGDLGGVFGPLKLDGEVSSAGVRRKLRLSVGAAGADGGNRLRLGLQNVGSPFAIDADGTLSLAGGKPAFQGRASLSMRAAGAELPPLRDAEGVAPVRDPLASWSLAGTVNATAQAIDAANLSLSLGSGDRPVELSGRARLVAAGTPDAPTSRLELSLAARQIDLNAATGDAAPLGVLNRFAQTIAPLTGIATSGTLDLSSDTVLLGGAAMREVRAGLDWSPAGWRARTVEARLPGRASVKLAGRLPQASGAKKPANAALFAGDITLAAEDLPAFIGWASPDATALIAGLPTGAAELRAAVALGEDRVALDHMSLRVGETGVSGTAAYVFPQAGGRGRVDAVVSTEKVDLDALLPPARRLLGLSGQRLDVGLSFSGTDVRLAGVGAAGADIIVKSDAGGLSVERLAVSNFGGLDLTGSGRLAASGDGQSGTETDGRFEARLVGAKADGLPALARAFGLPQLEAFASTMGARLAPLDVGLVLNSEAGRMALDAKGRLGVMSGSGQANFGAGRPLDGKLALDMADGSAVLTTLGVPGLRQGLGPARATFDLGTRLDGELMFAGATLDAQGKVEWDPDGRARPDLALKLDGADLARLFPTFAAGGSTAVPASLAGTLTREGDVWRVGGLAGTVGGQKIAGSAAYVPGERQPIEAELAMDSWSLPAGLGLAVGPVPGAGPGWPDGRFGTPALAGIGARVKLALKRLDLPAGLALDGAKVQARIADGGVVVEDLTGELAGGRFSGRFDLTRRGEVMLLNGHLSLTEADSVVLLKAANVAKPGVKGRVTLALDVTGSGRSPRAIAAALQGQGSLVVDGLEVAYTDPRALQYVMLATERDLPPDQARTVQLLNEGLSRGTLKLERVESALSLVNGVARSATARAAIGDQRFAFTGSLDIPALSFEATLEIEDVSAGGASGAPPGAGVQWRGPLAAPERRFDLTALTAAINMRALERETKRLEAEYGRTPLTNGGHSTDEMPAPMAMPPQQAQPQPQPAQPQAQPAQPPQRLASPPQPKPSRPNPPPVLPHQYPPPGSAAPPLAPPVEIPADPLRNPIMAPPLAP
ncbi:AsmA family protein [Ancylobacter sp. VNQ12]|uniref:AsmA family protein n=1 Tax=Ancylobacter sp. VNQ12 TaxID=3400920 RepID=UPI003BFE7516